MEASENEKGRELVAGADDTSTSGDVVHGATKLALALGPLLGGPAAALWGPAAVLFELAVRRPLEGRRERFLGSMATAVVELTERVDGLTAERLGENEAFLSAVVQATQIADRTHLQHKLDALTNAVQNTALPGAPDAETVSVFFRLVDQFTEWHIRILAVLEDPAKHGAPPELLSQLAGPGLQSRVITNHFPQLSEERDLILRITAELEAAGLIVPQNGSTKFETPEGTVFSFTRPHGRAFLAFIRKPFPDAPPSHGPDRAPDPS